MIMSGNKANILYSYGIWMNRKWSQQKTAIMNFLNRNVYNIKSRKYYFFMNLSLPSHFNWKLVIAFGKKQELWNWMIRTLSDWAHILLIK